LVSARPVAAQASRAAPGARDSVEVSGQVLDRESGKPVSAAHVVLEGRDAPILASADADETGAFVFGNLASGWYSIRIVRIGYLELTDSVHIPGDATTHITASMVPSALDLDPVVVTASRRLPHYMREFERRRAMGFGWFITREDIEERNPLFASDLFRMIPGLSVVPGRHAGDARLLMRGRCEPQLWIDGVPVDGGSIDLFVHPDALEAVEVYSTASVPPRFGGSSCGAVVVWSRVGGAEGRRGSFWKRLAVAGGLLVGLILLGR
jgi:hypothetical protein